MDLNKVSVEIRPRPQYEAIDLGFKMAANWFLKLVCLWFLTALPISIIIHLIFYNSPVLAITIIWWLKPLFETPLLFWISRALFDERPKNSDISKNIFKIVKPQLFSRLTYRRFSPYRSFYMPCILLENLKGNDYRKRVKVIGNTESAALILTLICILFEAVLYLNAGILLEIMIPKNIISFSAFDLFNSKSIYSAITGNIIYILSMAVIAPFYICSGFSLYISRRTELEAWDIELNFKRLIKRKNENKKNFKLVIILFLSFSLTPFFCDLTHASQISKKDSKEIIKKVLDDKDFGKKEIVKTWKLKKKDKKKEPKNLNLPDFLYDLFKTLSQYLAIIFKAIIWLAAGIILVVLLYFAGKYFGYFDNIFEKKSQINYPKKLFGLDLTKDSLPDNIFEEALKLINQGRLRKALSLLYRGALFKYIHFDLIEIPESATEKECLNIINKKDNQDEFLFFKDLTNTWVKNAYGGIKPEKQYLKSVCMNWKKYYEKEK